MSGLPDPNDPVSVAIWYRAAARLVRQSLENIMTSTASTTTPMKHSFEERVKEVKAPKRDINALILDYLTVGGFPKAAAKFCKEANLDEHPGNDSIRMREQIQRSIHTGSVESAVEMLNNYDSAILEHFPALHFSILRLQLVELIRACTASPDGDLVPALHFAQTQLGPRAAESSSPQFLRDLEDTMALLVLPRNDLDAELAALLHPDLRRQVADDVNATMVYVESQRRETAIRQLVQMRCWAESSAKKEKNQLPDKIDLPTAEDDAEAMMLS